jgi:tyrosinase
MHSAILFAGVLPLVAAECSTVIAKTHLVTEVVTTVMYTTLSVDATCTATETLEWQPPVAPSDTNFEWLPNPSPPVDNPDVPEVPVSSEPCDSSTVVPPPGSTYAPEPPHSGVQSSESPEEPTSSVEVSEPPYGPTGGVSSETPEPSSSPDGSNPGASTSEPCTTSTAEPSVPVPEESATETPCTTSDAVSTSSVEENPEASTSCEESSTSVPAGPQHTPSGPHSGSPSETPVETPSETPVETPSETPVETPSETPVETPSETPVETPSETPIETPGESTSETPIETPVETPSETPVETPSETPVETPSETPVETPSETPVETPVETSSSVSSEAPTTTSAPTSSEASTSSAAASTSSAPALPNYPRNYPADLIDDLQDESMEKLQEWLSQNESNGCTLDNVSIRREWGDLSVEQREDYVGAVLCLQSAPSLYAGEVDGARSRFDDFVVTHQAQTNSIHGTANFLTWHRYFLHEFEKALKGECGYKGVMPYWNWDRYADNLEGSPMFNGDGASLGGNAGRSGCVETGPFKDMTVNLGPGPSTRHNPRCLNRQLSEVAARYTKVDVSYPLITQSNNIGQFQDRLQSGNNVHAAGHHTVGGNPGSDIYTSPGDPYFHLHHAGVDRLFWIWQLQNLESRLSEVAGTNSRTRQPGSLTETMNLGKNAGDVELGALLNTMGGMGGAMCYIYY